MSNWEELSGQPNITIEQVQEVHSELPSRFSRTLVGRGCDYAARVFLGVVLGSLDVFGSTLSRGLGVFARGFYTVSDAFGDGLLTGVRSIGSRSLRNSQRGLLGTLIVLIILVVLVIVVISYVSSAFGFLHFFP